METRRTHRKLSDCLMVIESMWIDTRLRTPRDKKCTRLGRIITWLTGREQYSTVLCSLVERVLFVEKRLPYIFLNCPAGRAWVLKMFELGMDGPSTIFHAMCWRGLPSWWEKEESWLRWRNVEGRLWRLFCVKRAEGRGDLGEGRGGRGGGTRGGTRGENRVEYEEYSRVE